MCTGTRCPVSSHGCCTPPRNPHPYSLTNETYSLKVRPIATNWTYSGMLFPPPINPNSIARPYLVPTVLTSQPPKLDLPFDHTHIPPRPLPPLSAGAWAPPGPSRAVRRPGSRGRGRAGGGSRAGGSPCQAGGSRGRRRQMAVKEEAVKEAAAKKAAAKEAVEEAEETVRGSSCGADVGGGGGGAPCDTYGAVRCYSLGAAVVGTAVAAPCGCGTPPTHTPPCHSVVKHRPRSPPCYIAFGFGLVWAGIYNPHLPLACVRRGPVCVSQQDTRGCAWWAGSGVMVAGPTGVVPGFRAWDSSQQRRNQAPCYKSRLCALAQTLYRWYTGPAVVR